jgi:hypothetical protein
VIILFLIWLLKLCFWLGVGFAIIFVWEMTVE